MAKSEFAKILIGIGAVLCLAACSDEVDRRDELGIEADENGRYELVPVEGGKELTAAADSLKNENESLVMRDSTAALTGLRTAYEQEEIQQEEVQTEEVRGGTQPTGEQFVVYDPHGAFTVQIGGYRDAQKASALVIELNNAGYPAYAIARPNSKEMRVRIGYFKTQADAARFGAIFQADNDMEFWVDKRENE